MALWQIYLKRFLNLKLNYQNKQFGVPHTPFILIINFTRDKFMNLSYIRPQPGEYSDVQNNLSALR